MIDLNLERIGLYSSVSETSATFYVKVKKKNINDISTVFLLYKIDTLDGWCLSDTTSDKFELFSEYPADDLVIFHLCKFGYQPAITYIRKQRINTIL